MIYASNRNTCKSQSVPVHYLAYDTRQQMWVLSDITDTTTDMVGTIFTNAWNYIMPVVVLNNAEDANDNK